MNFKRLRVPIILGILIIAALAIIVTDALGLGDGNADPAAFVSLREISIPGGGGLDVHVSDGGFFMATHENISFTDMDGIEIFRQTVNMSHPILIGRGNFAALTEAGGQSLQVFGEGGHLYTIRAEAPISAISLNPQGMSALLKNDGASYTIHVYSAAGLQSRIGGEISNPNMIPVALDISASGQYLAISYLDINEAQMSGVVKFIALDARLERIESVFAMTAKSPNQLIGHVRFFGDNRLLAVSNQRIFLIDPHNRAEVLWEIPLNNRLSAIAHGGGWFAVALGEEILDAENPGRAANTVVAVNLNGQEIFTNQADSPVTHLTISDRAMIIGRNNHFTALESGGAILWQHSGLTNINRMEFFGNDNRALAISPTGVATLSRE
ncbi:MAG: DUF5711 family protein [Defluviitaleaceae bacterium]|nr:DUF5711 family protein [Defluviitaleaceae bacterium]